MPSPKGEYTPKRGPLAGNTFRSYFAYQQARSQSLGFAGYSQERRERSIAKREFMYRRYADKMKSENVSSGETLRRYVEAKRRNNGRQPRRQQIVEIMQDAFDYDEDDWDPYGEAYG